MPVEPKNVTAPRSTTTAAGRRLICVTISAATSDAVHMSTSPRTATTGMPSQSVTRTEQLSEIPSYCSTIGPAPRPENHSQSWLLNPGRTLGLRHHNHQVVQHA